MPDKPQVTVRRWRRTDVPKIVACHRACYPDYPKRLQYDERVYGLQFETFPEGQFLAEVEGRVVGYATSLIVQLEEDPYHYTYDELTGAGTFSTHDPSGDTLYGADIAVHPDFRGRRIAGKLYERRKRLVRRYNLRRMVAYGRIPGYSAHQGKLTAEEYVAAVTRGELSDPALSAHLRSGYTMKRVVLDFMADRSSLNYATLLEWSNPSFSAEKRKIAAPPIRRAARKIRVCAAQYFMRRIDSWEEFEQSVEFFVDSANAYHCHFLVLPELFTAQLIYTMANNGDFDAAIRNLTGYYDRYIDMFTRMATRYQLYIVGGTTPTPRDDGVYNVAHLFTPSGNCYTQDKLHLIPSERTDWGFRPGKGLRIFRTPFGRVAILVCYDIEFPEVPRLLALQGVEVIFVPFSTDERKAFNRVRFTAQARAIENYLYVVTAGNVGNLPTIKNYLLNYAQAAIYTPSDFAFPLNATAGEADPNVETVVVAELDLTTLTVQREIGSVRPFFDRRADLYELVGGQDIEIVTVE